VSGLHKAALAAIAVLVAAASLVSFAESYRALYLWAAGHGHRGVWAYSWPLQVDTFVAVGELALLVALRVAAWGVTVLSVAGNIGHVARRGPGQPGNRGRAPARRSGRARGRPGRPQARRGRPASA
jgi:hypothetical protein